MTGFESKKESVFHKLQESPKDSLENLRQMLQTEVDRPIAAKTNLPVQELVREALKQALEAQSYAAACLLNQLSTKDKHAYAVEKLSASTIAIEEALAQPHLPVQEKNT